MRLRQIEVFHAVYLNGSISAAARALNVSQPSVSKVLRHTEDQLGFTLFQLVRGRLVPTDEAHALSREVGDVFERLTSLQLAARNLRNMGGGHIRLAVVPSLGLEIAPRAIMQFRRQHPSVTFEVQTLHHDDLFRALYERECDIAIAYDPPPHPRLATIDLGKGELAILFLTGAFGEASERLPLEMLRDRDVIGVSTSGPIGDLFKAAAARCGLTFREVVTVQTFYIAASLARFGVGLTVVDEFTARASIADGLDMRLIGPPLAFSVRCVHLEDRPLSTSARGFVALTRQVLAESRATLLSSSSDMQNRV
jgi:DNA-binding transcriptional LysR family regulator